MTQSNLQDEANWNTKDYLTLEISGQLFGIPVLQVQDVLGEQRITKVPLASPEVAGALNLRGRIVTAIDVKRKLNLGSSNIDTSVDSMTMSVVVEHENELYSLIIDKVGDVLSLNDKDYEQNPATLEPMWRDVSGGIYRLDGSLLVVLDVPKLLHDKEAQASLIA